MTSSEDTSIDYDDEMLMTLPVTAVSLEQLSIDELTYLDYSDIDLCKGTSSCRSNN